MQLITSLPSEVHILRKISFLELFEAAELSASPIIFFGDGGELLTLKVANPWSQSKEGNCFVMKI